LSFAIAIEMTFPAPLPTIIPFNFHSQASSAPGSPELDGMPLTKTEKVYYSRVVKKKVVALAYV